MRRLVGLELTRLRMRRAVLLLLLLAVAIPVLVGVTTWLDTRPPSAEELARVDEQVARESQSPYVQRELRRCLAKPERYGMAGTDDVQALCESAVLPQREWYAYYRELDLASEQKYGSGMAVVVVLALVAVLVGTTFAGHDWNSGSMSNQLLFEPRRLRVWAAKAVAVTVTAGLLAVVVVTGYWLALYAVASSRDLPLPDGLLLDCLQTGWRGAGVAALAAFVGYALTMLFRSTVATLGVLFAVTVAGGLLIGIFGLHDSGRWQPQVNVAAVVLNGYDYYVQPPDACFTGRPPQGVDCRDQRSLSATHGLVYNGSLASVVALGSMAMFRRRDVP